MKKKLLTVSAVLAAASLAVAAPPPPKEQVKPEPPKPQVKPQPKPQPPKPQVKPMPKPQPPKPQVKPMPKPQPPKPQVKPMPKPQPPPPPVKVSTVEYRQIRNTYIIQLNADNVIIFEQRIVGLQELKDKIRMVRFDRPRPQIVIRVENGVAKSRLDFALNELRAAGFNDVQIVNIPRRAKFAPAPRIPGKRVKR